jgi:prepilin-type N-terminal cleavage/methylation domain-containing protein
MTKATPRRRRGFTLVELLIVITIIGMLMALTSVVIYQAIRQAKLARIAVELDHLSQAMQSYKEQQIQFPPSMSNITWTDRRTTFMRHVSLAFPNSNYKTAVGDFNKLRDKVMLSTTPTNWNYTFVAPGATTVQQLDLNTLDQAEALVFWLGGFPTPVHPTTKAPIAGRRLFGFHRDSDNPFKRDVPAIENLEPLRHRTDPAYGFDQTRLVDNDGDGWLEYVPIAPESSGKTAPYVYFDGPTYSLSVNKTTMRHVCYPRLTDTNSNSTQASNLAGQWGVAAPMAMYFDPAGTNPTNWAKDTGFQIICPGLDNLYTSITTNLAQAQRVPIFPTGYVYDAASNYGTQGYYQKQELDNLTNLSNKPLEGARSEAQK